MTSPVRRFCHWWRWRVWYRPHRLVTRTVVTTVKRRAIKVPWWQRLRWHRSSASLGLVDRYYDFLEPGVTVLFSLRCLLCGRWHLSRTQQCCQPDTKRIRLGVLGWNTDVMWWDPESQSFIEPRNLTVAQRTAFLERAVERGVTDPGVKILTAP